MSDDYRRNRYQDDRVRLRADGSPPARRVPQEGDRSRSRAADGSASRGAQSYRPRPRAAGTGSSASSGAPSRSAQGQARARGAAPQTRWAQGSTADGARPTGTRPSSARSGGTRAGSSRSGSYTPHYRPSSVTTYQVDRNRRRFYGIAAVIVVLVLAFGVGALLSRGAGSGDDPAADQQGEQQDESQGQELSFEGMPGVEYPDQASLAWRDEDFAVDPSRQDWNFEKSDQKVMYLTFDDGPSKNTQRVLDILDQYGCKATFFVIGHDSDYFPMIAEAYHRGHTIGLHSMTHEYSDVYASTSAYFEDLDEIGQVVKEQIGYVPCFVRFPGGSSNTVSRNYQEGIMTELSQMVPERGYQYYDWNLACGDGATVSTDEILAETLIEPESSNIMLLCHDAGAKDTTVEALPAIIEHFQARGYSFEAIDRSSWVSHHTVNN